MRDHGDTDSLVSRALILAEFVATGDPTDEQDWQVKLMNELIGIPTCPIRKSLSPRQSPTHPGGDGAHSGTDESVAGIDTCRMVTVRPIRRCIAVILTLLSSLAVPDRVSAASDPLTERPPSLHLRLPAAEPGFDFPPLVPSDLSRLPQSDQGEDPIGVRRSLSVAVLQRGIATIPGNWLETTVGSVWRLQMTSPDAVAIRVHVQNMDLGKGHLWIHGGNDSVFGPYTGAGPHRDGEFWSPTVTGQSLTVEYRPENGMPVEGGLPFSIDEISHIWALPTSAVAVQNEPADETQDGEISHIKRWEWSAIPQRTPDANRIVVGRPTGIRLPAVAVPTLFSGGSSYRFKVEENTESVEISLNSATRGTDVDLYLRFARESELTDGAVVADYRSDGVTGNERIVITKDSDPPLRPGTYFASLGLYSTGESPEGTLTVTPRYHSHACYIDLACRPEWERRASAVAKIHIEKDAGYSSQCSGVLLNDLSSSRTPYFLTAAHCVGSESEARSIEAHWYFQSAACNDAERQDPRGEVTHGAELLAVESGSIVASTMVNAWGAGDIALLRLREPPPESVAYLNWNVNQEAVSEWTSVIGIHHTEGLHKKISFGKILQRYPNMTNILWSNGFSLGGSSGSPLINESGEVIGVLSGGGNGEGCFFSGNNFYSTLSSFYPKIRSLLETDPRRAVDSEARFISTVVDVGLGGGERPVAVAVDQSGTLYVSGDGSSVRSISRSNGLSINVRGMDNGGSPGGIAPDVSSSAYVYVADYINDVVWRWNPVASTMRSIAGIGLEGYSGDDGLATAAAMDSPWALALDTKRNLYVGEFTGGRVREIDLNTGVITTVLYGLGTASGLAIDAMGTLYVADSENHLVWQWKKETEQIARVAGTGQVGYSGDGGPATAARLNMPYGMALDPSGNLYIADAGNHRIRRVDVASGTITTVAGTGAAGYSGDRGLATAARLNTPVDVAIDWSNNAYVADFGNGVVRRLLVPVGESSTLGGRLVSGVPRRFALRADSAHVMQTGDRSYTINVPSSASRLTLILAADNPRVDVDLYVSIGQDNAASRWNWRSIGPTGNEKIVIEPGSNPALSAGRYYISLMLYDNTSSSASGTLTAVLE